jgi:hypothetical protein
MMAMAMNENEQQRFVEKMCGAICAPILDPRMVFLPVWQQPTLSKAYQ